MRNYLPTQAQRLLFDKESNTQAYNVNYFKD